MCERGDGSQNWGGGAQTLVLLALAAFLALGACKSHSDSGGGGGTPTYPIVTFVYNHGIAQQKKAPNADGKVTEPDEPFDENDTSWVFYEWRKDGAKFDFDTQITEDITLTAHWTQPFYVTATEEIGAKVTLNGSRDGNVAAVEYSLNGGEWQEYTFSKITLGKDETVRFKAADGGNNTASWYGWALEDDWQDSGNIKVGGNIMTLLDPAGELDEIPCENCFMGLFSDTSHLVDASNLALPAKTLKPSCYFDMFYACDKLVGGPTLASATELPERCYEEMFDGCDKLENVNVSFSQAATLGENCCRNMFKECESLVFRENILFPANPAEGLPKNCYCQMFWGCKEIPQVEIMAEDFSGESCCESMFCDAGLKSLKVHFAEWPTENSQTFCWLSDSESDPPPEFHCPEGLTIPDITIGGDDIVAEGDGDENTVPDGWKVVKF